MPSTQPADAISERAQRRPMSLAGRLTLTYALATCLLLVIAAGLMYNQLGASLQHENSTYLSEELREVRADIREPLATEAAIRAEVASESPDEGDAFPMFLRVLWPDGSTVAQTSQMDTLLPAAVFPIAPVDDSSQSIWQIIHASGGDPRRFQIISATVAGMGNSHYVIQMALDLTEEDKLLAQYRRRIYLILVPALFVAVLCSYALAHGGLRPLRNVVALVRKVETTTLDHRIDSSGFPGELSKLAGSFNDMLERIEDSFERLAPFSADIAHELRTPLGCIRGELEVALGKARTPQEYREVLESCLEECVRLGHLIDRLLFLARAERQEPMLKLEKIDLSGELEKVREFYEAAAVENGIELKVDSEAGVEVRLDRTLIQSALGNLIQNALAHTPSGGSVKLSGRRDNGDLRLEVSDTGKGISPEHLPFVLDRFYRADGARGRQDGNVGLGLAIVKSIATLHGGQVRVESTVGEGTCVTLLIPAEHG